MKFVYKITLVLIFSIKFLFSQAQGYLAYGVTHFQEGNFWVYGQSDEKGYELKITVVDTNTIIDSISYAKLLFVRSSNFQWYEYYRLREDGYYVRLRDTSYPEPNHEEIYYKVSAKIGDSWVKAASSGSSPKFYTTVVDTFQGYSFNNQLVWITELYVDDSSLVQFSRYFTDEFGEIFFFYHDAFSQTVLKGCKINGVVYGDTSKVGTGIDEYTLTPEFILHQNYPNPFNSQTVITYELQKDGYVKLLIFDYLGREVAELVNTYQRRGKYKINFHPEGTSSGVYFYVLQTTEARLSRRMLLLK